MPSQTPGLKIPYPLGTDRVMDGDNAMQAIAERVDLVMGAGATGSVSAAPNYVGTGTANKRGGMVSLTINITSNIASTNGTQLGTVPAGFRPALDFYGCFVDSGTGQPWTLLVAAASGVIQEIRGRPIGSGSLGTVVYALPLVP